MLSLLSRLSKPSSFKWSWLQYPFFAALMIFDLVYIQFPPLWARIIIAVFIASSPWIPYVRRFTVPAMVVFTWLITFYAVQFIPNDKKPQHIFVNILPTLERIIYGANLSEIISKHTHPVLDIIAWIPYGVIHFAFPFAFSLALFIFGPPGTLAVFGQAFGYMNLAGVLTQLIFPTSPPWYELTYGSAPANYSIHGQPGGLARIDDILGLNLYGSTFGNSPLVFGAFPSLHSGCATIEMLFLGWLFPKARIYCVFHVMWMWFATMYLTHHYLIDLVGGSIYATLAFFAFRHQLPDIRKGCITRLDYIDSKVPVKCNFGNFARSIEMEKFVEKLRLVRENDMETSDNTMLLHETKYDYINNGDYESATPTTTSTTMEDFTAVTLQSANKKLKQPMYINTGSGHHRTHSTSASSSSGHMSSLPSTTTSPTCSGPPSPLTPHSDVFPHHDMKYYHV